MHITFERQLIIFIINIVLDHSDRAFSKLILLIFELYLAENVESTKNIVVSPPRNTRHNYNINLSNESFGTDPTFWEEG
jgi:hypothetical protein